ncbi:DUF5011/hyalin repeat domain-containing protein [Traorella massiliensis]|uniref:hypothetical protein n=1 Tax=Traorella massiliensis TaxID=1903263 RepID=UPI0008F8030C|nr:hypothetical protein [Traorella massiliensis]
MKKLMKSLLSMALMFSVVACSSADNLQLETTEITVEYGEALSLEPKEYLAEDTSEDVLKDTKVEVFVVEDDQKAEKALETDGSDLEVGNYILSLSYNDEVEEVNVTVEDTTAPEFVDFNDTISIEQGIADVALENLFKAEDASSAEITVEGNVDFNTAGTYPVKVTAKDEYENTTEKDCSIVITEKEVDVETPNTSGGSSGGSSSSNSSSSSSNSSNTGSSNNTGNTGGSSNTGSSGSSSSGSSNTGSSGSGGSTITQPSQPEVTECQHEYSNVGSTGILTDEYPGDLAEAIYSSVPGDELFEKYIRPILEKNGGNYAVDVYPVRCEKCKQSLKYTINVY